MTTILAITSYLKGEAFLRESKNQGARVILLTEEKLRDKPWPWESIDQVHYMPDLSKLPDVIFAVAWMMRSQPIHRIVPLDEYDVEMAAILREHLRLPGMGITATRKFRDKLIMRETADAAGILVPPFTRVVNHEEVHHYTQTVPAPWVLKPRLEAGAMGIKRVHNADELWGLINFLGDEQSFKVLEQYIPGDVYHADSITYRGETLFTSVQKYGQPPLNVSHDGGIFTSTTLPASDDDARYLIDFNQQVIQALGLTDGPTHAEFIKAHADGRFYFLEIAARVGGAHIADLVDQARGINLWAEWARMEIADQQGELYRLPAIKDQYGGLLVSLAKQEHPDLSAYSDPEVTWRLDKAYHAGLIVTSPDYARVSELVDQYRDRFVRDFLAVGPVLDKPLD